MRNVLLAIFYLSFFTNFALGQDVTGIATDASTKDCNNGTIDLTLNGGSPPYSFSWSGDGGFSSSEEDISNLNPGYYQVTVYDDHCCEAKLNFLVKCTFCVSEIVLDKLTLLQLPR